MSERDVRKSQIEVSKSTAEFDRAMQHLEETIEDSGQKVTSAVESAQEIVQRPVRKIKAIRERLRQASVQGRDMATQYGRMTLDQTQQYYRKAQDSIGPRVRPMVQNARNRPDLVGAIAGAIVVGAGGLLLFLRRRRKAERIPMIRSERSEDYAIESELTALNKRAA